MTHIKRLAVAIVILFVSLSLSPVYGQPFWTEKSIYSDGEYLFSVGIATNVSNKEDGRIEAFDNGVKEVCKLMGVSYLPGLVFPTQMTYEEDHKDGTYTVYRLLRINEDDLKEEVDRRKSIKLSATIYDSSEHSSAGYVGSGYELGNWTARYPSGKKEAEVVVIDNEKYIKTYWYESGAIMSRAEHFRNKRHGKATYWYEHGQKKEECGYNNGQKHGKRILWYEGGQKKEESNYNNGRKDGNCIKWYEHGKKEEECSYNFDRKHGKCTMWYLDGRLHSVKNYSYGKIKTW